MNGIPQINLFDRKGTLLSTFIGKQEEIKIKNSIDKLEDELGSREEIFNSEFSSVKFNNYREVEPRSHG